MNRVHQIGCGVAVVLAIANRTPVLAQSQMPPAPATTASTSTDTESGRNPGIGTTTPGGTLDIASTLTPVFTDRFFARPQPRTANSFTVGQVAFTSAVNGTHMAASGTAYGVYGQSASTSGQAVHGLATSTSGITYGGVFEADSTGSTGVFGVATAASGDTFGGSFTSNSSSGTGVFGNAPAASGLTYGVSGESESDLGTGVLGMATAAGGSTKGGAFYSQSTAGRGVYAETLAASGLTIGVQGVSNSTIGIGVDGSVGTGSGIGVRGRSNSAAGFGVEGINFAVNGYGVLGTATASLGIGVYGVGNSVNGYGVVSDGNAYVGGNLTVAGSVSKGGGSFKIDHPLEPADKYLSHSFVESPDMMNIYNGNAVLDQRGEAWVELPEWFESLNRDFRYQLTAIGGPGPNLYVAEKVHGHRFQIGGGQSGLEVSWQVTGVRQDPYAEAHRIKVEEDKPTDERGYYLYPEEYGQPKEKGISYNHGGSLRARVPPILSAAPPK